MAYGYEDKKVEAAHTLVLEGRSRLNVTGVTDVERFDEASVVLETNRGTLIVRGSELHMETLSLEGGQVTIDGTVDALSYEDTVQGGFFARLFG